MKITLDLSKLVEDGKLTAEEAARLRGLAAHDTGSLAINILVGFGVVAVSAGALALVPTPGGRAGARDELWSHAAAARLRTLSSSEARSR